MGYFELVFKVNSSWISFIFSYIFSSFLHIMKVKVTFATIVCFLHSWSLHYQHLRLVGCTFGFF